MLENWYVLCDTPLHEGEAEPFPAQPPLSRPTDQKASRVTYEVPLAQFTRVCASASENISPGESFCPIMGVQPIVELRPAA
jgi:hypothetical protein